MRLSDVCTGFWMALDVSHAAADLCANTLLTFYFAAKTLTVGVPVRGFRGAASRGGGSAPEAGVQSVGSKRSQFITSRQISLPSCPCYKCGLFLQTHINR